MENNDEPLPNEDVEINDESAALRDENNIADSSRNDDENPSNINSNLMNAYQNLIRSLIEIQELRDNMKSVEDKIQQLKIDLERNHVEHDLMMETLFSQSEGLRDIVSEIHQLDWSVEDEDPERITLTDVIQTITDNEFFQNE